MTYKSIIPKGDIIIARIDIVAKESLINSLFFGSGLHICPGQHYAKTAIKEFIAYVLNNYEIEESEPNDIKLTLAFTYVLENELKVNFNKIS